MQNFQVLKSNNSIIFCTFALFLNMNRMKNRKIVFAFAILMTNALFAQKTHFQMSSLRPDTDSAFSCRVTAKYDNGRFVQYTGCTIFPYTSTKNAKVRLSFDADEVPRFLEFLERVRDKYAEWSNTATTNHVRGFSKKMPIEMKSKGGIWSLYYVDGKPPRSTFDMNRQWEFLIPFFKVDNQGKCFVEWSTGNLEYHVKGGIHGLGNIVEVERCNGGQFVFASVQEIQSLIDCFVQQEVSDSRHDVSDLFH